MFTAKYKELRVNASLKAVAEEAVKNRKRALRQLREFQESLKAARSRGEYVRPETEHRERELREYFNEVCELAKHLSRLAKLPSE